MSVPFLFLSLSACWAGNNAAVTAAMDRQFSSSMLRVAQLEALLSEAELRITQLEEVIRVQGQNAATRLENLDEVNREVSRLRGELEVIRHELDSLQKAEESRAISGQQHDQWVDTRLEAVEKLLGVRPPPPPEIPVEVPISSNGGPVDEPIDPSVGPTEPAVPEDAAALLELAVARMTEGNQPAARAILQRALDENPGAPEAAEIQYRIGETWFNEESWLKAARAFMAVRDGYGQSPWWAWSTLRIGECFDALGQPDNARLFYKDVVDKHPASDAAKEAKAKLGK